MENTGSVNSSNINNTEKYLDSVKNIEKFSEAPEMQKSPFLPAMVSAFEMTRKVLHADNKIAAVDIYDKNTGELVSSAEENRIFVNKQHVDKKKFVKIYYDRLSIMFNLSKTAIKVFGYIMDELAEPRNINQHCIYLNIQDAMEWCEWRARNMVYTGLTELIAAGFIARASKPPNHYWIDPKTAFNRNRVIVLQEYIKDENRELGGDLYDDLNN